jgi:hypothetical protein
MSVLFVAAALAAGPPCAPIQGDLILEGEHFWVQWDESVADAAEAQQVLDWAEEARAVYQDLGWNVTDETMLVRIEQAPSTGGLCTTTVCDEGQVVPLITLFSDAAGKTSENTTKHEVVHAFEYAYMGTYLDAITSWSWWVEGTATWLTSHADDDLLTWRLESRNYLEQPWLGLHQTPLAYSDPQAASFLYGTAFLAQYIEDEHGMDAMRRTWEYGAVVTGTPIYLPDAIEGAGIEWAPFWQDYLATLSVMDTPYGDDFASGPHIERHVRSLPADGSPKKERQPQGMGVSIVHISSSVGVAGRPLEVSFTGVPEVSWMGVLVRTKRTGPGGRVKEVVPIEIGSDGEGSASLEDFDGSHEAYLVVSPQDISLVPRDFSWSVALGGDLAPESPAAEGCACTSLGARSPGVGLFLVLMLGLRFRRRPSWTA